MFLAAILGFWLVAGVAFFGWRRLANGKQTQLPRVVPGSGGGRA